MPRPDSPRLQRVLARAGIASRRHAEALIAAGRVQINGQVVRELGTRVDPVHDAITVDGRPVTLAPPAMYLALHKPAGILTSVADKRGRPTVMSLVPPIPGLFPVGRLDAESEGLLLLTTDGDWAQRVAHPRYGCTKEYLVEVGGRPAAPTLERLRRPMRIGPDEWTTGAEVTLLRLIPGGARLRFVLHEGRNRQIRRMCELAGHPVRRLVRTRVGAVELGPLKPGEWRYLTPQEVTATASALRQPA